MFRVCGRSKKERVNRFNGGKQQMKICHHEGFSLHSVFYGGNNTTAVCPRNTLKLPVEPSGSFLFNVLSPHIPVHFADGFFPPRWFHRRLAVPPELSKLHLLSHCRIRCSDSLSATQQNHDDAIVSRLHYQSCQGYLNRPRALIATTDHHRRRSTAAAVAGAPRNVLKPHPVRVAHPLQQA